MEKLTELAKFSNDATIDALTDQQRYEWYLRIKQSLPRLRKIGLSGRIEQAIFEYEQKHNIS